MADFFEKIRSSIDKGIKTVSAKGKELLETTKLKREIRDVEANIQSKFNALGKKVFEMINRGALDEEELKESCREISALYKRITELESAIKEVELKTLKLREGVNVIVCSKCKAANKSDAKFCMNCGSAIEKIIPESKNCSTCGAALKEGAKFCMMCGTKIE